MKKKRAAAQPTAVPCDSRLWSASSQQSYSRVQKEYRDHAYRCRVCGKDAVFSALEQKIVYETKKAYIHQQRVLCASCWDDSLHVRAQVGACELRWAREKAVLASDRAFLRAWHDLLLSRERYGARQNFALKAMLAKLLGRLDGR